MSSAKINHVQKPTDNLIMKDSSVIQNPEDDPQVSYLVLRVTGLRTRGKSGRG